MAVNDLLGLHQAVARVCPIDGVGDDGQIWFQTDATAEQKAAAQRIVETFQDSNKPAIRWPTLADLPPPKSILEP